MLNGQKERQKYKVVPASQYKATIEGLQPGTWYLCQIQASTRKGYGEKEGKIYFTAPGSKYRLNQCLVILFTI